MSSGPTDYPKSWEPRGMPQAETPAAPAEAVAMAIDSYIASLSDQELNQLLARTRG